MAAHALADEPLAGRVIIIVTDGNETQQQRALKDVVEVARNAHAAIYVVAIESAKFTPGPLKHLAAATGGRYYGTASSAALRNVYASIANELKRTWRLEYLTAAAAGGQASVHGRGPRAGVGNRTSGRTARMQQAGVRAAVDCCPRRPTDSGAPS